MALSCSLLQISAETLFGNIPSLIRVHRSFWEEVLGPTLEKTRASGQPLDPVSLKNGFLTVRHGEGPHLGPHWESPEGPCLQGMSVPHRYLYDTAPTPKYHLPSCPSFCRHDL